MGIERNIERKQQQTGQQVSQAFKDLDALIDKVRLELHVYMHVHLYTCRWYSVTVLGRCSILSARACTQYCALGYLGLRAVCSLGSWFSDLLIYMYILPASTFARQQVCMSVVCTKV